jgi:hypothetical protein
MRPLPEFKQKHGCFYRLIKRSGSIAMYSLCYLIGGPIIGLDVGRVRQVPEHAYRGEIIPAYEQFPIDSDYGSSWWSYTTRESAEIKFNELQTKGIEP